MSNCCANSANVLSPFTAAKATFALKAGVWFRRGRLVIVSPGLQPFWLLSGRNSTYPDVQISWASSAHLLRFVHSSTKYESRERLAARRSKAIRVGPAPDDDDLTDLSGRHGLGECRARSRQDSFKVSLRAHTRN